jgi:hypothetical protein
MFTRNKQSTADLAAQLATLSGTQKFEKDPTEWVLTSDKAGNGAATIRFLPAKGENGELVPFVKIYNHSFKDPVTNKWYIENCATTIGGSYDDCPVCSTNGALFESGKAGNKADADLASKRSRKLSYWANIVVIKDEANPEAVGKVFKYRFGKKIFEKIQAAAAPTIEEIQPIVVTDVFDGANFYLKVKQVSGFANYDDSVFGPVSELFGGDEAKLEAVWKGMHPLKPITDEKQFKSKEDLEKSYARATGATAARKPTAMEREVAEAQAQNPTRVHKEPAKTVVQTDDIPFDEPTGKAGGAEPDVADDLDAFLASLD